MIIDLAALLRNEGSCELVLVSGADGIVVEDYRDYHFTSPLTFKGTLTSERQGLLRFKGLIHINWTSYCSRCSDTVEGQSEVIVEEEIRPETAVRFRQFGGEEETEGMEDPEELPTHDSKTFVPDKLLTDLLLLNLPLSVYCNDDCPGLCPQCGRKKDDPDCECRSLDVASEILDSPFDKLRGLL